jgi:hypothetical protein
MSCDILKLQGHILAQFWYPDIGKRGGMFFELFPCILKLVCRANEVKMHGNTLTHLIFAYGSALWANTHKTCF